MNSTWCFCLVIFLSATSFAQDQPGSNPSPDSAWPAFSPAAPVALFLHVDKELYTQGETLWFAAYLQKVKTSAVEKTSAGLNRTRFGRF